MRYRSSEMSLTIYNNDPWIWTDQHEYILPFTMDLSLLNHCRSEAWQLLYVLIMWPKQIKTYYGREGENSWWFSLTSHKNSLDQMVWQAMAGVNCRTSQEEREISLKKKKKQKNPIIREWSLSTMKFIHSKEITVLPSLQSEEYFGSRWKSAFR